MQAQTAYTTRSISGLATLAFVAMLAIGAVGGYEFRAFTSAGASAQASDTATVHTALIPRSAREDDVVNTVLVPLPRILREGPERADGTR